jgi:hypothetical protein
MKPLWSLAAAVLVLLSAAAPAVAQDNARSRATLAGLDGVLVVIAGISDELVERGITEEVVFAEVQLQLREARIELLDGARRRGEPRRPILYVEVLANLHEQYDQASFSVRVEVRQEARLARNSKIAARSATTWSVGGIGESGTNWRDILRDELSYYVGRFVDSFLEANPE